MSKHRNPRFEEALLELTRIRPGAGRGEPWRYDAVDDQTSSRSARASGDRDASVLPLPLEGFLPPGGELLSNFPLTCSHVGLVDADCRLAHATTGQTVQNRT